MYFACGIICTSYKSSEEFSSVISFLNKRPETDRFSFQKYKQHVPVPLVYVYTWLFLLRSPGIRKIIVYSSLF